MSDSISKPLNESLKESLEPSSQKGERESVDRQSSKDVITESVLSVDNESNQKLIKRYKIITGVGACIMIIGLFLFLALPPIIHSQIVSTAIEQSVLRSDNEGIWAHFPGESETVITRNYSFFNLVNENNFLLHGEKPKFREIEGYIITEKEDFENITYNEDQSKVEVRDWLHFELNPDSRSLNESAEILNLPSLAYWYTLKNTRPSVVFLKGFSTLFTSIETSIKDVVIAQGINSQYLPDFNTAYLNVLQPAGISHENSRFIFDDVGFGLKDKNNLQYWVKAARTSFADEYGSFSESAFELKDYFTLSDSQLFSILTQLEEYIESLEVILFENHYCQDIEDCNGRELAIRQIASSYVTFNTPAVSTVFPNETICHDNKTCDGYFPEINSFYNLVYLIENPHEDPFLTFDVDMVRGWLDYNPSGEEEDYNKAENVLFHIGNLDFLFDNGVLHDANIKSHIDTTVYLTNIKERFKLESHEHTRVFWEWVKYLVHRFVKQGTTGNEVLGISDSFTNSLYESFSYLKDNLQTYLLTEMIKSKLSNQNCNTLVGKSFQIEDQDVIANICNNYTSDVQSNEFIEDMMTACKWKYHKTWLHLKSLGPSHLQMENHCDETISGGFTSIVNSMKIELDGFYECEVTPYHHCSDYELAIKQWISGRVTLKPPPTLSGKLETSTSFSTWDKNSQPFEYYHFTQKFPEREFPLFTVEEGYSLFNFDNIFSALQNINRFVSQPDTWKDYMRYMVIFIAFKGYTHSKTAYEHIFGYFDDYLLEKKNQYPPFGGDPSINAFIAFNEPNITADEAVLQVEFHTGKDNHAMTGQYSKINGLTYLTNNYTRFDGNKTYSVLESPWAEKDYFYGTTGKSFAPDQPNTKNASILVPNIQRYGSADMENAVQSSRFGYDVEIGYLGDEMYQTPDENPDNAKYYTKYFAVFNETSLTGAPLFMTKHHFLNCSSNWTTFIDIYNEDETIKYEEASSWDDSYVVVEPYSGAAFQSTLYLQGNYLYEPDQLFTYNQTLLLPMFSIYRSGNLTEDTANKLFGPLTTALNAKTAFFYVGIVLSLGGAAGLAYGFTNYRRIKRRKTDTKMKESIKISMQPQSKKKKVSEDLEEKLQPLIKEEIEESEEEINRQSVEKNEIEIENNELAEEALQGEQLEIL